MKIEGIKKLDANGYDEIIINSKNAKVVGGSEIPTMKSNNSFSKSIRGLTSEEKIDGIIDHYLKNNILNGLNNSLYYLGKEYIQIQGTRNFRTCLLLTPEQMKKILLKYHKDRIESLTNKNISKYNISVQEDKSNYEIKENEAYINLCTINAIILPMEKEFFTSFIKSLLADNKVWLEKKYKKLEENQLYKVFEGYKISGTNKEIIINSYSLLSLLKDIIKEHNDKIDNKKILQKRLEKF